MAVRSALIRSDSYLGIGSGREASESRRADTHPRVHPFEDYFDARVRASCFEQDQFFSARRKLRTIGQVVDSCDLTASQFHDAEPARF